ncbi:MAG TPA: response regulator transcription factor [Acidimicrobiales bacterium]|nr:response regulator transcription factor [Acidimicrobiales bacterium]
MASYLSPTVIESDPPMLDTYHQEGRAGEGRDVPNAKILIIEDDPAERFVLEMALKDEEYEVQTRADGVALDEVLAGFRADLAIVDVRLPVGPDGYELAERLREDEVAVLLMSGASDTDDRLAGFEAGADDYVPKPISVREVLARVNALLRRAGRASSGQWQVGDLLLDDGARTAARNGEALDLTPTEFDLLRTLARHPGQLLSKIQLLNMVWGFDGYDRNVVEVHMSSLRHKLDAQGPPLISTVRGSGYVLEA